MPVLRPHASLRHNMHGGLLDLRDPSTLHAEDVPLVNHKSLLLTKNVRDTAKQIIGLAK